MAVFKTSHVALAGSLCVREKEMSEQVSEKKDRVASIDVLRGLAMFLILIGDKGTGL
ncbi:MAG: hypothetical protein PHV28_16780 [Kiritimatiellae bacterium]|nr:hypothetical protein [Kiritimatiellia bacterium]